MADFERVVARRCRSTRRCVELAQQVAACAAASSADSPPGGVRSATGLRAVLEERALVRRRQEAAAEAVEAAGRDHAAAEHDEAGQVPALAAQAVGDPRAHARPALLAVAGVQEVVGVGVLGEVRRPSSGRPPGRRRTSATCGNRSLTGMPLWPYLLELPRATASVLPTLLNCVGSTFIVIGLPCYFVQARLGVERVDLRRAAVHEQEDDGLGLRGEVRLLRRERVVAGADFGLHERGQCGRAERRWRSGGAVRGGSRTAHLVRAH